MPRPAAVLTIILLILLFETSSGQVGKAEDGSRTTTHIVHKIHSRKTLVDVMDYDYGGPNSRHDPKRGKPGNGGKNP